MNWYKTAQNEQLKFYHDNFFEPESEIVFNANIKKLDKELSVDKDFYVGFGGKGGDPEKYENIKKFKKLSYPRLSIGSDGLVGILDGRHRFAFLRDSGYEYIPIIIPKSQEQEFRKRFS